MEFINFLYYTWSFLVGAHGFVVPFPKLQTFSGIIWKLVIFVDLFICKVTTTKVHSRFYKQCSQAGTHHICEQAIFFVF